MKSYTITAAPGTYLIDSEGDATDPVIAWVIGQDDDGELIAEPITPIERLPFAEVLLMPDGKVWDGGLVFDTHAAYREHRVRQAERLAELRAKNDAKARGED